LVGIDESTSAEKIVLIRKRGVRFRWKGIIVRGRKKRKKPHLKRDLPYYRLKAGYMGILLQSGDMDQREGQGPVTFSGQAQREKT